MNKEQKKLCIDFLVKCAKTLIPMIGTFLGALLTGTVSGDASTAVIGGLATQSIMCGFTRG